MFDSSTGNVTIIYNDHQENTIVSVVANMTSTIPKVGITNDSLGKKSSYGKVGSFKIWSKSLTMEAIEMYKVCDPAVNVDLLSYDKSELDIEGLTIEDKDISDFCHKNIVGLSLVPEINTYDNIANLCQRLGGSMAKPDSSDEMTNMQNIHNNHSFCHQNDYIWYGFSDKEQEGYFIHQGHNEVDPKLFDKGEPNGDVFENCAALRKNRKKLIDIGCRYDLCGFCMLQDIPEFRLRGWLPDTFKIDRKFYWTRQIMEQKYIQNIGSPQE